MPGAPIGTESESLQVVTHRENLPLEAMMEVLASEAEAAIKATNLFAAFGSRLLNLTELREQLLTLKFDSISFNLSKFNHQISERFGQTVPPFSIHVLARFGLNDGKELLKWRASNSLSQNGRRAKYFARWELFWLPLNAKPFEQTQKFLGHSKPGTIQIYAESTT